MLALDRDALNAFLTTAFPQAAAFHVTRADAEGVTLALTPDDTMLRPGGTISGPAMFALADVAIYALILSRVGPVALAVTTNASIDFMRKPAAGLPLRAEARLLKLGRTLAVADALIYSKGIAEPVARASMTYSLPQNTETKAIISG